MKREDCPEEYLEVFDIIEAFNARIAIWESKLQAAWDGKRLREYLWLRQGEVRTDILRRHFDVTSQQLHHVFRWLRRWGWQVNTERHFYFARVKLIQPPDYQPIPPIGIISPGKRKPPKPPKQKRPSVTVADIISLQAQGHSLGKIAKLYGLHPSTPCQILRRARLSE